MKATATEEAPSPSPTDHTDTPTPGASLKQIFNATSRIDHAAGTLTNAKKAFDAAKENHAAAVTARDRLVAELRDSYDTAPDLFNQQPRPHTRP